METTFWILEATGHSKFSYRIRIVKGEENLLCLCEDPQGTLYPAQEIERAPVISLKQYGKRLASDTNFLRWPVYILLQLCFTLKCFMLRSEEQNH